MKKKDRIKNFYFYLEEAYKREKENRDLLEGKEEKVKCGSKEEKEDFILEKKLKNEYINGIKELKKDYSKPDYNRLENKIKLDLDNNNILDQKIKQVLNEYFLAKVQLRNLDVDNIVGVGDEVIDKSRECECEEEEYKEFFKKILIFDEEILKDKEIKMAFDNYFEEKVKYENGIKKN